jgi:hypothetical protein
MINSSIGRAAMYVARFGLTRDSTIILAILLLAACSHSPSQYAGPERSIPAAALADCPRPVDMDAEFFDGGFVRGEHDPCMPALNECMRACEESPCGKAMIGGGCSHLCGSTERYLARARRFRAGEFDEQCRSAGQ